MGAKTELRSMTVLGGIEPAVFGCLGGLLTWTVSFALPEIRGRLAELRNPLLPDPVPIRPREWVMISAWLLIQLAISGLVSSLFTQAHSGIEAAAAFGMAAEGLIAGASRVG
jgi:hypothetical protein